MKKFFLVSIFLVSSFSFSDTSANGDNYLEHQAEIFTRALKSNLSRETLGLYALSVVTNAVLEWHMRHLTKRGEKISAVARRGFINSCLIPLGLVANGFKGVLDIASGYEIVATISTICQVLKGKIEIEPVAALSFLSSSASPILSKLLFDLIKIRPPEKMFGEAVSPKTSFLFKTADVTFRILISYLFAYLGNTVIKASYAERKKHGTYNDNFEEANDALEEASRIRARFFRIPLLLTIAPEVMEMQSKWANLG